MKHGHSSQVLVVEDDPVALELSLDVLASAGYLVFGVSTVAAALDSVGKSRPHLVVLDVYLGEEDGLEVVRRLRRNPATRDIPVVASSASTSQVVVERAMLAGCESFLSKPLTPHALLAGVSRALRDQSFDQA